MDVSKHYIHLKKESILNQEVQLKLRKNRQNKLQKLEDRNLEPQEPKRRQQSDGVISIAGNKQRLWKAASKKTLGSPEKTKYQMYFISVNL